MTMEKIGRLTAFILFFAAAAAFGAEPPKVTVVATPNPLPDNESLQLRIEIVVEGMAQIYPPEFDAPEFTKVGSGLSGGTSSIAENGNIQLVKRVVYTYVLFPKKQGALRISNIVARVGNDVIRPNDMVIKVVEAPSGSSAPTRPGAQDEEESNPAFPGNFSGGQAPSSSQNRQAARDSDHPALFNSDFTVHAEVDKRTVFVGEPVIVDYYIYDLYGVQNLDVKKWPTFTGFRTDDLERVARYQFEQVYVQNRRMRRAFLGRFALYPIKPGKIALDKLVVNARYVSRSMFGADDEDDPMAAMLMGTFGPVRQATHASQDVTIDVQPLPEAGRPANFGGVVGQFTLKLEADKSSVAANTPLNLNLTVEGKGDFQAISTFKLPLPADFELYDSTPSARGSNPIGVRRSLESQKSFQYVVIPRKAGNFQIPPIQLSFFDPEKKSYHTVSTNPLDISVSENNNPSQNTNNNYLTGNNQAPAANIQDELRYLKDPGKDFPWSKLFLSLFAAIALVNAFLVARALKLRGRSWFAPYAKRDSFATAYASLAVLKKSGAKDVLSDLEETILIVIQEILGTNPRGMTRGELEESWKSAGLPFEVYQRTSSFLDTLDQLRFSSSSKQEAMAAKSRLFAAAEEIIGSASRIKRK